MKMIRFSMQECHRIGGIAGHASLARRRSTGYCQRNHLCTGLQCGYRSLYDGEKTEAYEEVGGFDSKNLRLHLMILISV